MTNDELRLEIAKLKLIPLGTAQTHDFRNGYGPIRTINTVTGEDVPNWPEDIAAAETLLTEIAEGGDIYEFWVNKDQARLQVYVEKLQTDVIYVYRPAPYNKAEIISLAYLEWNKAQA